MRERDLHRLLTMTAEDVRPSYPAATGWDRARRVRRRRRVAGAAALAVALVTGAAVLAVRDSGPPAPPAPPAASPTRSVPPVQQPPAELTYPGHPLGRLGDPPSAPLSARPVRRALALYQPVDGETYAGREIRVLGDDGLVRTLDVVTPRPTRDRYGNEAPAVKPGTLSPDGRSAAFAQTDELILVDLATAAVRRIPLDGYLELVVWSGDRLLVGGDDGTYSVDPVSGAARRVPVSAWDVVVPDPAMRTATLLETGGLRDGLTLRRRAAADGALRDEHRVNSAALPGPYRVDEFYGRGWQRGDRVARAGWTTANRIGGAEGVVVLDAGTGTVTHLLDLGRDRYKGCCEVLGWDADGAVLLRLNPGGLARWRPETGEVTGILRNLPGMVALAG